MRARSEVEAALAGLESEGRLNAASVVRAAKDPSSPLHSHFEWDDSIAAQAHREDQARALIRSVKVTVETVPFSIKAPAYVPDPDADVGYVATLRLRSNQDRARDAVVAEFSRAAAALARARAVAVALGVADEVDALRQGVVGLSSRVANMATAAGAA